MEGSMLAAVLPGPGAPLQIERIPIPRPRRGEALVRVASCGVCHTDLHVMKGEVAFPTPAVLGHEISGTVDVVPAALAGIVISMDVPNAELVAVVVALAIIVTLLVQATTKKALARRLGLLDARFPDLAEESEFGRSAS